MPVKRATILSIVCVFVLLFTVAGSVQADNAYRYYMLYKNSETYKKLHDDKRDSIEEETRERPQLDGWGNLVDEPPPPENTNDKDYTPKTEDNGKQDSSEH